MNQNDIIKFFNSKAPSWDENTIRNEESINEILDLSQIAKDKSILDIACGTGVLFPDYLKRDIKRILGVDISPKMVDIANDKWKNESRIKVICADAQTLSLKDKFDIIMIHNAFPHFENPKELIKNLSKFLSDSGRLTVAHSMSREDIDACHIGAANKVSIHLMHEQTLKELMSEFLDVDIVISDSHKYVVSGKTK